MRSSSFELHRVTWAVLAGGEGRRMGQPKGNLRLKNKAILEYLLERMAWPGPTLLVTAPSREHPPGGQRFDREARDPESGLGPLRGVLTALESTETEFLLVTTVDMPALRPEPLAELIASLDARPELAGLMTRRRQGGEEIIEPFPLALRRSARATIERQLSRGKRSVYGLSDLPDFAAIPAPPHWPRRLWTNLNAPADVRAFERESEGEAENGTHR